MEEIPGIRRVVRLDTVDSTQKAARKLADEGAEEWTLIWADQQTAGRGRLGRRWSSGPGGLYISLILRPKIAPKRLAELSLATADAVAKVVNDVSGLKTAVKPPNDVLAQAAASGPVPSASSAQFKKVCGILIEASGGSRSVDWVVLGIGLNVNNKIPKTLPGAASMADLTGREFSIEDTLRALLAGFRKKYHAFLTGANGHIERPVVLPEEPA